MNTARISIRGFFAFSFFLGSFIGLLVEAHSAKTHAQSGSQENYEKIEKKIPPELLAKPEIAADVERLRSLRKNAALFGKKHPALAATEKQIAELESKLSDYIPRSNRNAKPEPFEAIPKNPKTSGARRKQSDFDDHQEVQSDYSRVDFGTDARLVLAYPKLGLSDLTSVGVFPSLGLMWGIEFDSEHQKSRIWQWHDLPEVSEKFLYFETDGVIQAIAFPSNLRETPFLFMMVNKPASNEAVEVTVLQIDIEPLPPFLMLQEAEARVLMQAKTLSRDRMFMTYTETEGLLLFSPGVLYDLITTPPWGMQRLSQPQAWSLSESAQASFIKDAARQPDIHPFAIRGSQTDGVFEVLYLGNALGSTSPSRLIAEPKSGNISLTAKPSVSSKENKLLLARTSRGTRGIFYDTVNEPVLIDDFGQPLTIELVANRDTPMDENRSPGSPLRLPRKISQTNWFTDIAQGRLSTNFLTYDPSVLRKELPKNVQPEFFLYVPKNKEVGLKMSENRLEFPPGSVLLQNLRYNPTGASPRSLRTLGLVRTELEWIPFVYDWNYLQDDAILSTNQDDEMPIVSTQEEMEFMETRNNISKQNCLACHQGSRAIGGLGISNSRVVFENSLGNQSVGLEEYLMELGYLKER